MDTHMKRKVREEGEGDSAMACALVSLETHSGPSLPVSESPALQILKSLPHLERGPRREVRRAWDSSLAVENLLPLTPQQLAAFQDVFKLFSSSLTGTVDMRIMQAALHNVGVQLSPQEMCEALRQADLDSDGTLSFKDFLGVLTGSHRLAQCLGQVRNSRFGDPQGLQTLFLEMLFKLMSQGFVPSSSVQEVMSYYSKRQQALRLNPSWKGPSRGHGRTARAYADLTFFRQAARLGGLSSAELARSLHRLHKAGTHSPYSQIPNLARRTRTERNTRNRAPRPDVRLSKSYQPSRPKLRPNRGPLSQGESGEGGGGS
ncbi:PREDICTED: EF-hand calcium-binding domain-containing protein 3-like [Ceratotherium simum simum]|uniref:EF-hand calcium-binding domain-containing protein 3-like n=1 Tax=Ceratotherium simum simum TaxID=73337 RepID=A0ABM1CZ96_CERSS|nr:PREDICTED: EF-hand calcium-binding domain-containing protein 3-like [Ceratotherium simum simum]